MQAISQRHRAFALFALMLSAFAIGTTEFVAIGILPNVAQDLGISLPTAGRMVSVYALGVVVGGPILTALTGRVPRKWLLVPAAQTDHMARARLFRVIAHSQDLGLRTLRQVRGAAPAQFKTAPTAAAVAALLPAGNVFVQIFRRTPRAQGFSGAAWRPERAEYIALVVRAGCDEVLLVELGPASPLDEAVERLLNQMETGTERPDLSSVRLLHNSLAPHIWDAQCVFFAPDGALQAFPFSMLMCFPHFPTLHPVVILVESAARWMEQRIDGERAHSSRNPCVICAPECGRRASRMQACQGHA